jgi:lipopolysaccharide biosynthesis glycosyltransferase
MKILVYTASDFSSGAQECLPLLRDCFITQDCDFKIVTNKKEYATSTDVIYDDFEGNFAGLLKYSKNIPSGYDKYIYTDLDVLFFGNVLDLVDAKEYSCVIEDLPMLSEWFRYPYAEAEHLERISHLKGFNSGVFSFEHLDFLAAIREAYSAHVTNNMLKDAQLDQRSLNYILAKKLDYNTEKLYDLSPITQMFADENSYSSHKKVYHFCGFEKGLEAKAQKMKTFLNKLCPLQHK